jgi:leader peptidase (prepilin peptidase) / N-methyltransferase
MSLAATMTGLLTGVLLSPVLRWQIVIHSVAPGEQWRTHCPSCGRSILLIGWSSRCRTCHTRLGPFPGSVEIVAALVLGLLATLVREPLPLFAFGWIAAIGVVLAFVDVKVHRLPDRLTFAAFGGAVILLALADLHRVGIALLGSLALAAVYLLLVVANPGGMGLGDAKLALCLGLALGWYGWVAVVYGAAAGFLLSGLFAVVMLALRRMSRKDSLAHGPFMLLGALAALALLV